LSASSLWTPYEEAVRRQAILLRNPLPAGPGVCGICRSAAADGYQSSLKSSGRSGGFPPSLGRVDNETAKDVVRRGYDALSARYDEAFDGETKYGDWLDEILTRLPSHSRVLDLGCGSGVPVALTLTESGHQVTGVDLSEVQVSRARTRVPAATFIQADATKLNLPAASFDAVLSFYALIHIPLDEQQPLLDRIAEWLHPGGLFVATVGSTAWTGAEQNWLGGDAPMWWSHADAATTRIWIEGAGFVVEREEFVAEGSGGHTLLWASRV